jgi:isoleucyl-tRNA synthetase
LEDLIVTEHTPISGSDLLTATYHHPLYPPTTEYPILPAQYVTSESGTGLVHSAPGHGEDDYNLLNTMGIAPFSPVDNEGRFTAEVGLPELEGLPVLDKGTLTVMDMLRREGALIHRHNYKHKYPYDWRSKTPVIVRATEQWFTNVGGLKGDAVKAILSTNMIPESCIHPILSVSDGEPPHD